MARVLILYYSRTGNTEKMAKAVVEGAHSVKGVEVGLRFDALPEELGYADAIVVGMPTYNHDVARYVKTLLEDTAVKGVNLRGKVGAAFGSYGWSGEAPQLILEIFESKFGMRVLKPPLLIKYAPDEKGLEECRRLGRSIAEQINAKTG